jgi:integrase
MTKVDINEAFKMLLEHGRKKGLRKPTLDGYQRTRGVLRKHFAQGSYPVGQLAYDASIDEGKNKIHELLNKKLLGTIHTNTVDNIRIGLSRFFGFCVQEKLIKAAENPMIGLEPHREPTEIHTLTVEQTRKLLRAAEKIDPGFVGIWALLLFGGLRPTETSRLATDAINFERKTIKILKSTTKTKRPRYVTMNDTLEKWLLAYPIKYNNLSFRYRMEKVREGAGFALGAKEGKNRWIPDITRHTCATMILARNKGDYMACARELGNSESVLRKHYESFDRPTEKEIQEYFGILPELEKSKPTEK